MNNLLTIMIGWAQLARRNDIEPARREAALEILERNARRARDLAAGCLNDAGSTGPASQLISMDAVVADLLELHALEFENAGIAVSSALEPGLVCVCHPSGLFQVLENLVRNAVDALPRGGGLRIESGSLPGDRLFVAVEDDGPGVDPAFVERMFEPFSTTKRRVAGVSESGSGLGLCLCRRIARGCGGDVSFSPAPGGGARFVLELPRVAKAPAEVATLDAVVRQSIPPGLSVLVVDDEADIREMILTALTLRGAHVATAADGEAALDACREGQFDLALVDFSMQGLSGHELGRALSGLRPELPLVYMSGDRIDVRGLPQAADFLKKPFDIDEIQQKVREVLGRRAGD